MRDTILPSNPCDGDPPPLPGVLPGEEAGRFLEVVTGSDEAAAEEADAGVPGAEGGWWWDSGVWKDIPPGEVMESSMVTIGCDEQLL